MKPIKNKIMAEDLLLIALVAIWIITTAIGIMIIIKNPSNEHDHKYTLNSLTITANK